MKVLKNKILIILLCASVINITAGGAEDAQADILNKVKNKSASSHHRIKTLKELEEKRKGKHAILAIKSTSCSACNIADEAFAEIKEIFGDEIVLIESLIEFSPELKKEFDVTSVPTILVFKKDKENPTHTMRGANKHEIIKHAHTITGKQIAGGLQEKMKAQREAEIEQTEAKDIKEHTDKDKKPSKKEIKKETSEAKTNNIKQAKNIGEIKKAVKASKKPVVLRIHSKNCPACKNSKTATQQLAKKHSGKALFIEAETSEAKDIASHFGVTAVPTYVICKNGNLTPIETIIGADLAAVELAIS
jgi:thioredoxin-like negative regulator of GroEL